MLCHHMMDGQFKNGRVITDYSRLAESLQTIQDWPSPYGLFKVGPALIDPHLNRRQYVSFISTSSNIGCVRPYLDDDKTLRYALYLIV